MSAGKQVCETNLRVRIAYHRGITEESQRNHRGITTVSPKIKGAKAFIDKLINLPRIVSRWGRRFEEVSDKNIFTEVKR